MVEEGPCRSAGQRAAHQQVSGGVSAAQGLAAQQQISARRLQLRVDKDIAVIIDEIDGEQAIGRSMADAPEIDGRVYLPAGKGAKKLKIGEIVTARVTDADEYDLWAEPR